MTDLSEHLERLGLEQYLDVFAAEGFDQWEILLDIQESDLEKLRVKLGHRRKLQRAIADFRGIAYNTGIDVKQQDTFAADTPGFEGQSGEGSVAGGTGGSVPPAETKRKYRRHPKPDDNAPEKPPSAYVLFSNKIREDVKSENLSFTEIAKLVGERWQKLDAAQREPFESHAHALKEAYTVQHNAYKKTDSYKQYAQYLADFKTKHGQATESKRPKLDPQSSGGTVSTTSPDPPDATVQVASHVRGSSIGSQNSHTTAIISPGAISATSSYPGMMTPSSTGFPPGTSALSASPPSSHFVRERQRMGQLSSHGSTSDDLRIVRGDTIDPSSRSTILSSSTPSATTTPLPHNIPGAPRLEHSASSESFNWSLPRNAQQTLPLASPPHGSSITLPSPMINVDPWREHGPDSQRQGQAVTSPHGGFPPPLTLAPIIAPDRLPDLTRAQTRRTLPPPLRQYPSSPHSAYTPVQIAQAQAQERNTPPSPLVVEHHESEAATTLATLAKRPAEDRSSRRDDPRR